MAEEHWEYSKLAGKRVKLLPGVSFGELIEGDYYIVLFNFLDVGGVTIHMWDVTNDRDAKKLYNRIRPALLQLGPIRADPRNVSVFRVIHNDDNKLVADTLVGRDTLENLARLTVLVKTVKVLGPSDKRTYDIMIGEQRYRVYVSPNWRYIKEGWYISARNERDEMLLEPIGVTSLEEAKSTVKPLGDFIKINMGKLKSLGIIERTSDEE